MKLKLFDIKARKANIEHKRRRYALSQHMQTPGFDAEAIKAKLAEMDTAPDAILSCPQAVDINAALAAVNNGKTLKYTYNVCRDLMDIASNIEAKLERHGVPTAKAYNRKSRSAVATRVSFLRGSSAWYVTAIERVERYTGPGGDEKIKAKLPDAARDAVVRNALADFE